jgi:hypothetical protein
VVRADEIPDQRRVGINHGACFFTPGDTVARTATPARHDAGRALRFRVSDQFDS